MKLYLIHKYTNSIRKLNLQAKFFYETIYPDINEICPISNFDKK